MKKQKTKYKKKILNTNINNIKNNHRPLKSKKKTGNGWK